MKRRRLRVFVVAAVAATAAGGWVVWSALTPPGEPSVGYEPHGPPRSSPLSKAVPDDRPPLALDLARPWRLDLGRGSGWHGLDTVALESDGRLTPHQQRTSRQADAIVGWWESAAARLPPEVAAEVLTAVEADGLLGLDRAYNADVSDGTQWVLRIRQDGREKSVYFNNHFPDPVVRFAGRLDALLASALDPGLRWRAVPRWEDRNHEEALWASIRR